MKQILIPLVSLSALVACDMNGDAGTEGSGLWSIRYKSAEEQSKRSVRPMVSSERVM